MITAPDRLQELVGQRDVAGVDFVYVYEDQVRLDVYFHPLSDPDIDPDPGPLDLNPLVGNITPNQVRIYSPETGERVGEIALRTDVSPTSWSAIDGRAVLHLQTENPGDFTRYRLFIDAPDVDSYYNNVAFSFKANCPSDLDCAPQPPDCPPEEVVDFPIDYRARDFWSFRRALLDFAAQRYPGWTDRLEADAGIMLTEVMSALGDELAYYQDRIGREAHLETATQRRSVRRHARLVDYLLHDGLGATTWLDFTVQPGQSLNVPPGTPVYTKEPETAPTDRPSEDAVYYEVGRGLKEVFPANPLTAVTYPIQGDRNAFAPHLWDEDDVCLPVGATEMYLVGHQEAILTPFDDNPPAETGLPPGKWVLLQTTPDDPSIPARRHMVRLIAVTDTVDPVLGVDISHVVWEAEQALPFEINQTFLHIRGNLVPATAGRTFEALFIVGDEPDSLGLPPAAIAALDRAVERGGPAGARIYLCGLSRSDADLLVWLGDEPRTAQPEVRVTAVNYNAVSNQWEDVEGGQWDWRRALIGTHSSQSEDDDYTLDDGLWRPVIGFQRPTEEIIHRDYASGEGFTVRFGDGEFGRIPPEGTVFRVQYRLGGGKRTTVAVDTLTEFASGDLPAVTAVTNPLTAVPGLDPESLREVRQLAPEAFRAVTYRAVRPEDYAEAAERLPWVQRAGAAFRWTGSWLSAFVTPDPLDAVTLSEERRLALIRHLDRFRQAGREAWVLDPVYASIDLVITLCVAPTAYRGEVKERVLEGLFGRGGARRRPGYFSPENFTFGTALDRSTLEATIQAVPGVRAVEGITLARRGWFAARPFTEFTYDPGLDTIIRIENDPLHPDRGTVKLKMNGGA